MEEIIRRLRRNKDHSLRLKESMPPEGLREADEDEEIPDEEDIDIPAAEDEEVPDEDVADEESEEETEEEEPAEDEEEETSHVNPLDNEYAVRYGIGDEVSLDYTNGADSKLKGVVDGYDKEGFYRIKWINGMITNGITDLALADFVTQKSESKCVCGNQKFVNEGTYLVCDTCGRKIRESKSDEEDTIIRPECHDMSTAKKPSIAEMIKSAFQSSNKLDEDYEDDEDGDDDTPHMFRNLRNELEGQFWTRLPELVEDIEDLGQYEVLQSDAEGVVVINKQYDDFEYYIPLGGTSRTMVLDFSKARLGD